MYESAPSTKRNFETRPFESGKRQNWPYSEDDVNIPKKKKKKKRKKKKKKDQPTDLDCHREVEDKKHSFAFVYLQK